LLFLLQVLVVLVLRGVSSLAAVHWPGLWQQLHSSPDAGHTGSDQ
jgi:hypothetical protein